MNKTKKKGFTIVELVIVIAVIAILAAVLIPTFSGLIKKANQSADEQAVYQMNTALAIYTAENGKPENPGDVKLGLYKNGINTDTMSPVTQGYAFYWDKGENKIVLVGEGKATAEEDWYLLTSTGYGIEKKVTDVEGIKNAINESSYSNPVLVKLQNDVTLTGSLSIDSGKVFILDLNGKKITSSGGEYTTIIFNDKNNNYETSQCGIVVNGGANVTIKNGIMEYSGQKRAIVNQDGSLVIENMTINVAGELDNKACCVFIDGLSDTSIVNSTLKTNSNYGITSNSNKDRSDGSRLSVINSTVETNAEVTTKEGEKAGYAAIYIPTYANVVIDNCMVVGSGFGAYFRGCNAEIKNSTIYKTADITHNGYTWYDGSNGYTADILFAAGVDRYASSGTYSCENVKGKDSAKCSIFIHQPDGAKVTLTGATADKTYTNNEVK